MKESHIAIVGLPGSGKTVLLTVLTSQHECEPLNEQTCKFLDDNKNMLQTGDWAEWKGTDPSSKALGLNWKVIYKGKEITLASKDFAGEVWEKFIDANKDTESASPVGKYDQYAELENYLQKAAGIVLCIDLQKIIDQQEDSYRHKWIGFAIKNFLPHNANIALVITKYDLLKDYVQQQGGLEKVLQEIFGKHFVAHFEKRIFPVAAAEFEFSPDLGIFTPVPQSASYGINELEKWIYGQIFKVKEKRSYTCCFFYILMIMIGLILPLMRNSSDWSVIAGTCLLIYSSIKIGKFIFRKRA